MCTYIYLEEQLFGDPALQNNISKTAVGFSLTHQTKSESFSSQQYGKEDVYPHHPINLFQPELLLYSTKNKSPSSHPGNTSNLNLQAVVADPDGVWEQDPICLKPHLDLCLVSGFGVVSSCSVKGWFDRQTYKQTAFISLRETWQQRAQLPGHITPIPLFSPFIFPVIAPPCWRGGTEGCRGALKSHRFVFNSLFVGKL